MIASTRRALRAMPTLLRIGVAETVAYRAEFLVWILTSTMPLIMLALWTSVAKEAPFREFSSSRFVAYYLSLLIVRHLTSNWVAWQMSEEIRTGVLSMRLLRPIHPIFAYATTHIAALPFRSLIALPLCFILLISSGASALTTDPLQLALLLPSLFFAWLITFGMLFALGCTSFWFTQMFGLLNFYFGVWSLLSGYLLPLALLPDWIRRPAEMLPFYATLGAPTELMTQSLSHEQIFLLLARQLFWAIASIAIALWAWRRGVKRFEAVGG